MFGEDGAVVDTLTFAAVTVSVPPTYEALPAVTVSAACDLAFVK